MATVKPNTATVKVATVKLDTATFLANVFTAARSHGGAFVATVNVLREGLKAGNFTWKAGERLDTIKREYQLGHYAGIMGVDRAQAVAAFDLSVPPKDKPRNDKHRTVGQQNAYQAAIVAWARVAKAAGAPKARAAGAGRKSGQTGATPSGAATAAKDGAEMVTVKRTANLMEVRVFAEQLAALMGKFIARQGEGVKMAGYHAIFTDYIGRVLEESKAQEKPAAPAKAA